MSDLYRHLVPIVQSQLSRGLQAYAFDLFGGLLDLDTALIRGTTALSDAHANASFAGRALAGYKAPIGELDRTIGRMIAEEQAQWFERFLKDVRDGRYTDDEGNARDALIQARSATYAHRLRGTANESWVNTLEVDEVIHWRLGGDEGGSCSICPDLAERGPYKPGELPTHPGANQTPCLFNCRCWLQREGGGEGFKYFDFDDKALPAFGLHFQGRNGLRAKRAWSFN